MTVTDYWPFSPDLHVIALSGPIASGKSTLAKAVRDDLGFELLRSREFLEAETKRRGFDVNDHSLQKVGLQIVSEIGGYGLTLEVMKLRKKECIVYDSFRNMEEVEKLRQKLGERFIHVFLDVPRDIRKLRFLARTDRQNTEEDFEARHVHQVEEEVTKLQRVATLVICDSSTSHQMIKLKNFIDSRWDVF